MTTHTITAENWVDESITYEEAGPNSIYFPNHEITFDKVREVRDEGAECDIAYFKSDQGHEFTAYRFHGDERWFIQGIYERDGSTPENALARIVANEF